MNMRGFTLVEIIVAIAVMGILMSIAMFNFNDYSRKANVESQTRKLYSDIMSLRGKGLYEKHEVALRLSTTKYSLYSSTSMIGPYQETVLKSEIEWNSPTVTDIIFDTQGLSNVDKSICVKTSNNATVDSIIIFATMVKLGKLKDGENCGQTKIDAKQ